VGNVAGVWWWLGAAAAVALIAGGVLSVQRPDYPPAEAGKHGIVRSEPPARAGSDAIASNAPTVETPEHSVPAPSRSDSRVRPTRPVRPVRDVEFVAIPTAVGLPPLESATIVRAELPLSALPEYGLQISTHAAHAVVQADLLVGQDGVPRGIRLVSALEDQVTRSRQ